MPAASPTAVAYYGSWLDDASVVRPRDVWVSVATGVWRGAGHRQIDVPVASLAVGVTPRIQAGASASFQHFRAADGLSESGFGSVSAYGKFQLVSPQDPSHRGIGVAITPLVEFTPGMPDTAGWALPVNIETRHRRGRVYGSAGYFSRGSAFATAAADTFVGTRAVLTATFGQSYANGGSHLTSVGAGLSYFTGAASGIFVGLGHTFMPAELGVGGLSLAGGISFLLPHPTSPSKP